MADEAQLNELVDCGPWHTFVHSGDLHIQRNDRTMYVMYLATTLISSIPLPQSSWNLYGLSVGSEPQ